jgi:hypothetical protein
MSSLKNQIIHKNFDIQTKNSNINSYSSEKINKSPLIYAQNDITKINICSAQAKIFSRGQMI